MKANDCVCFNCQNHELLKTGQDYDCGCESGPFFDQEACDECKHKEDCPVPRNKELYSI